MGLLNRIVVTFALINKRSIFDQYLTQHWPFCNSDMNDQISTADMTPMGYLYFTQDKFGNANSAVAINGSWAQGPSGVYFETKMLTIYVWINAQRPVKWSSMVDFSENAGFNQIQLTQDSGLSDGVPSFCIHLGSTQWGEPDCVHSSQALTQGQWQMLTSTYDGATMKIYLLLYTTVTVGLLLYYGIGIFLTRIMYTYLCV